MMFNELVEKTPYVAYYILCVQSLPECLIMKSASTASSASYLSCSYKFVVDIMKVVHKARKNGEAMFYQSAPYSTSPVKTESRIPTYKLTHYSFLSSLVQPVVSIGNIVYLAF